MSTPDTPKLCQRCGKPIEGNHFCNNTWTHVGNWTFVAGTPYTERDALRAENERLFTAVNDWVYANGPDGWINALRAEVERLTEASDYWRGRVQSQQEANMLFEKKMNDNIAQLTAERDALAKALAASCEDERAQMWEAGPGGGCARAIEAERGADTIEALQAERDALQNQVDNLGKAYDDLWEEATKNTLILTVERDALRADAERWRHFKAHCTYLDYEERGFGALISPPIRRWYHDTNFTQYDNIDAAIDAARTGRKT